MSEYLKMREWLNAYAKQHGGISALARHLDAPIATIYRTLRGDSPPVADKLVGWLEKLGARISYPDEVSSDFEMIPKVSAQAGAGSSLITSDQVTGYYAFRADFLGRENISVKSSVLLDVMGRSMEPLICDKDTILVDQSDTMLRDGFIYLIGLGDELLVKRMQRTPKGWIIHSENPAFCDIPVNPSELEDNSFRVYGRVRWFGRAM